MTQTNELGRGWVRGVGIGIIVAVLTALFMMGMARAGLAPFPKPPSLAFAETLLARPLPLPVGLLFHAAYVIFWSVLFVRFFPRRTMGTGLILRMALWLVALLVFFPIVGWGIAGMHVSPKLAVAAIFPHTMFWLFLWLLNRFLPPRPET
jgi:hypothetical protein